MKKCVIGMSARAALAATALFVAAGFATPAVAASVTYVLDLSNALPDGIDYAQVTISDSEINEGDIDFVVELIPDSLPAPSSNFGLQSFYFNVADDISVSADNISIGTSGWSVVNDRNAGGGFGKFDLALKGKGNSRTTELSFSISGVEGDTIDSYALGSMLNPSSGEFFAAHIAGFSSEPYNASSAKFAGSSVVPVPAAAWLFMSALGLLGLRRRA